MLSTADLPLHFTLPPIAPERISAVRRSGLALTVECDHGRVDCPACVVAAAETLCSDLPVPVAPAR